MDLYKNWVAAREEAGWSSDRKFCADADVAKDKITYLFKEGDNGAGVDTMERMVETFNRGRVENGLPPVTDKDFKAFFPRWAKTEVTTSA